MGVQKLKIKNDLNYRKGGTAHDCHECNHYIYKSEFNAEPRCRIMGNNPGRLYRINPKYICDKHNNSDYLKRLRGY